MQLETAGTQFSEFLAESAAFWREHSGARDESGARIYVDLAHDNPAYLLTNLWIAKYLQRLRPARIIGLAAAWPKPCAHYDVAAVKKLGAAFLLDDVIDLDEPEYEDLELTASFSRRIEGQRGHNLRQAVLSFADDQEPDLGWILYDTWLRQERRGTFDEPSAELIGCASRVFRIRRSITAAMQHGTIAGTVVGHYHYSPYAWIAIESVRRRAPVYFQSLLLPVSIRRFATERDVRRGRAADFLPAYETLVSEAVTRDTLDSFERRMFDVQGAVRQFFRAIPQADNIPSREQALQDLGLLPDRPVVCLFVPALSGPAHCFGPLPFDDNGTWLKQSLAIAAETPSVNFLVKGHPQDAVYDVDHLVDACEAEYGLRPNIRFLPAESPLNRVAALCDVAVTVSGTPGYELPARGVAAIAAGPSRYSDLGFSVAPPTYEAYRALLQDPSHLRLSADQQQAAVRFLYFEMAAGRSQALFLPPPRAAGTAAYWTEAAQPLRSRVPEEDPLFRNLRHMVAHDLPFLLNVEAAEPDTAKIIAERDAALGLIGAEIDGGRRVRVGRGQAASVFLTSGWSVPEDGGIWTDGLAATIAIPSRVTHGDLCIECAPYRTDSASVHAASAWQDGRQVAAQQFHESSSPHVWRVPVRGHHGRIEVALRIDKPVVPPGGTRQLGIWMSGFRLDPPGSRVSGRVLPLDYAATASFFEARGALAAENPLTATMYQDASLAMRRDAAEKETALPLLAVASDDRVLDLGCGSGRWATSVAPIAAAYLGIDFSESLLQAARTQLPGVHFQAMNVAEFDATKLAVAAPFTRVICSGILAYLNDPDIGALFTQLSRITAERSRVYLREPMATGPRLTLTNHWSDELQSHYSAIYRTRSEYLDLLRGLEGFRVRAEGEPFPADLQNRTETSQRFLLLERGQS